MDLNKLYELEYRGGRAASAPQTRTTAGTRAPLANTCATLDNTTMGTEANYDCNTTNWCDRPIMPHRTYDRNDLDQLYPSIEAVEAVDCEEEESDPLLEEGNRIARGIVEQASLHGRRRIASDERRSE